MRSTQVESPLSLMLLFVGLHFLANISVLANLSEQPQRVMGVGLVALEQAFFGAWTLVGFVVFPNVIASVMFRVPNVVEWYVVYLVGTLFMCFCFMLQVWLSSSLCDELVPHYVQAAFGATVACTSVDAAATAAGLLVFVAFGLAIYTVALVAKDLQDDLVVQEVYGTFAQAKQSLPLPTPRMVPQSNPFLMPPKPSASGSAGPPKPASEAKEPPNPFAMPAQPAPNPFALPAPPAGGANPFHLPEQPNPFAMPAQVGDAPAPLGPGEGAQLGPAPAYDPFALEKFQSAQAGAVGAG